MTGPEFKAFVVANQINKAALCEHSEISPRSMDRRYKDKTIKPHHLVKLRRGVEILTGIKNFDLPVSKAAKKKPGDLLATEIVKGLESTIVSLGRKIEKLESNIVFLQGVIKEFCQDNNTYRTIILEGLKNGSLILDKSHTKISIKDLPTERKTPQKKTK
jgi:hypothetical protein